MASAVHVNKRTADADAHVVSLPARDDRLRVHEREEAEVRFIRQEVQIDSGAPARARHLLRNLAGLISAQLLSDAQLLTSELVSQRVQRATSEDLQGGLKLDISLKPERLRVQLTEADARRAPGPVRCWELELVAQLADRWGVRHEGAAMLWFELDR